VESIPVPLFLPALQTALGCPTGATQLRRYIVPATARPTLYSGGRWCATRSKNASDIRAIATMAISCAERQPVNYPTGC
jgi:hypothetical protein